MYKLFSSHIGYANVYSFETIGALLWFLNTDVKKTDNSPIWADTGKWMVQHHACTYELKKAGDNLYPVVKSAPIKTMLGIWIDELLDVATDHGQRPTAKLPAQMTRANWDAIQALQFSAFDAMAKELDPINDSYAHQHQVGTLFMTKFGYGLCGPKYDGYQFNSRHEVHVCYALASGKVVPEEVIADYQADTERLRFDSAWFQHVVDKPFLRGQFKTISMLAALVMFLGGNAKKGTPDFLTEDNLPQIHAALEPLGQYDQFVVPTVAVDDALFRAGLLAQRAQYVFPAAEIMGEPCSEFAEKLHLMLAQWKAKSELDRANEDYRTGKIATREFVWRSEYAANMVLYETYAWANRVAKAVEGKQLEGMLNILDGPGNETSQKAVEQHFGIKLRNVTAKQRRRALFELAGFKDDEAVRNEEARLAKLKKEREAENDRKSIIDRAASFNIRLDEGEVMTCALYVDTLIQRGFNQVQAQKKGRATNYYLMNPANRNAYPIGRANGTLEYANMLLEKQAV